MAAASIASVTFAIPLVVDDVFLLSATVHVTRAGFDVGFSVVNDGFATSISFVAVFPLTLPSIEVTFNLIISFVTVLVVGTEVGLVETTFSVVGIVELILGTTVVVLIDVGLDVVVVVIGFLVGFGESLGFLLILGVVGVRVVETGLAVVETGLFVVDRVVGLAVLGALVVLVVFVGFAVLVGALVVDDKGRFVVTVGLLVVVVDFVGLFVVFVGFCVGFPVTGFEVFTGLAVVPLVGFSVVFCVVGLTEVDGFLVVPLVVVETFLVVVSIEKLPSTDWNVCNFCDSVLLISIVGLVVVLILFELKIAEVVI